MNASNAPDGVRRILTKWDIVRSWLLWYVIAEMSNSFARLQSVSFCACMIPILRKLYPAKADLTAGLNRYIGFFNTQATWGSLVHGMVIDMEERRATGEDIAAETIDAMKTNLMGPIAGIGDTIDWGLLKPIIIGLFIPLALTGSMWGSLLPFTVFTLVTMVVSYHLWQRGYRDGRAAIAEILASGRIQKFIFAAGIVGLMLMGALAGSFVMIALPETSGTFGGLVSAVAPLALILGAYSYMVKYGPRFSRLFLVLTIVCCVASFFGVL
ncbi:MAG: PTS system mannose/fructose/sorbose family transporter subunit IID [Negativicutes bacterium]|nr:PTS system mannose/fructose/sorbose family transporter subunit IID [Negativicutes bacterium]